MNCIIIDDEPLARGAMERLIQQTAALTLMATFKDTEEVIKYMENNPVDLIFLDIEMPGTNGIDFARIIPRKTLVVFTTAYPGYALDSYEVDAIDYLVKPIELVRFQKAIEKANTYHSLLINKEKGTVDRIEKEYIFIKSERKFHRINFRDILFIEGLKDYVIIQTQEKKLITRMYLKLIQQQLPENFMRINKSFIVNTDKIDSFDSNDIYINNFQIGIGYGYREKFYSVFFNK